ncbi:hypothetical protein T4D_6794 [Trichinella pseudospiralis]|uniref:Uncharacterized protein n=1 Tax=Trichinella pseudospiralis TaxID=6337 RepID=A0A0V1G0Z1_TRIPS|nr:hypothetical protein T4D_6794 [Trichinella pseudospiralis]
MPSFIDISKIFFKCAQMAENAYYKDDILKLLLQNVHHVKKDNNFIKAVQNYVKQNGLLMYCFLHRILSG